MLHATRALSTHHLVSTPPNRHLSVVSIRSGSNTQRAFEEVQDHFERNPSISRSSGCRRLTEHLSPARSSHQLFTGGPTGSTRRLCSVGTQTCVSFTQRCCPHECTGDVRHTVGLDSPGARSFVDDAATDEPSHKRSVPNGNEQSDASPAECGPSERKLSAPHTSPNAPVPQSATAQSSTKKVRRLSGSSAVYQQKQQTLQAKSRNLSHVGFGLYPEDSPREAAPSATATQQPHEHVERPQQLALAPASAPAPSSTRSRVSSMAPSELSCDCDADAGCGGSGISFSAHASNPSLSIPDAIPETPSEDGVATPGGLKAAQPLLSHSPAKAPLLDTPASDTPSSGPQPVQNPCDPGVLPIVASNTTLVPEKQYCSPSRSSAQIRSASHMMSAEAPDDQPAASIGPEQRSLQVSVVEVRSAADADAVSDVQPLSPEQRDERPQSVCIAGDVYLRRNQRHRKLGSTSFDRESILTKLFSEAEPGAQRYSHSSFDGDRAGRPDEAAVGEEGGGEAHGAFREGSCGEPLPSVYYPSKTVRLLVQFSFVFGVLLVLSALSAIAMFLIEYPAEHQAIADWDNEHLNFIGDYLARCNASARNESASASASALLNCRLTHVLSMHRADAPPRLLLSLTGPSGSHQPHDYELLFAQRSGEKWPTFWRALVFVLTVVTTIGA